MEYIVIYWDKTKSEKKPRPYIDAYGFLRVFTKLREADNMAVGLEKINVDWECRVIFIGGIKD